MVDADIALGGNRWFGVQRDPCTCKAQHAKVVRPVTYSQYVPMTDPETR